MQRELLDIVAPRPQQVALREKTSVLAARLPVEVVDDDDPHDGSGPPHDLLRHLSRRSGRAQGKGGQAVSQGAEHPALAVAQRREVVGEPGVPPDVTLESLRQRGQPQVSAIGFEPDLWESVEPAKRVEIDEIAEHERLFGTVARDIVSVTADRVEKFRNHPDAKALRPEPSEEVAIFELGEAIPA